MKPTPSQSEVRASLRGRLEDVIEELEAVRGVMRDELPFALTSTGGGFYIERAIDYASYLKEDLA